MTYVYLFAFLVGLSTLAIALGVWGFEMSLKTVATDVGLVAAIITGMGVIWAKFLRPFFFHVQTVAELVADARRVIDMHKGADMQKMAAALERIEHQVTRIDTRATAIHQDGPVGIFMCDARGSNIEVNRTYCRWLGCGRDELLGHGWRRFLVMSPSQVAYDDECRQAFTQGREVEFRVTFCTVDGEHCLFAVHAYPLAATNGKVTEYLGVIRPVE
jgi:PAS domain S-box-containing protein